MASLRESKIITNSQPAKNAGVRRTAKPLLPPEPPVFTAAVDALAPHLNSNLIASLSKSRITALAKKTALKESDLTTLVAAYEFFADTDVPSDAFFGLAKQGGPKDAWEELVVGGANVVSVRGNTGEHA